MSVSCGVCGRSVEPDRDHTIVQATHKRIRDMDDLEEYYLHDRCAESVLGGWTSP